MPVVPSLDLLIMHSWLGPMYAMVGGCEAVDVFWTFPADLISARGW